MEQASVGTTWCTPFMPLGIFSQTHRRVCVSIVVRVFILYLHPCEGKSSKEIDAYSSFNSFNDSYLN